MEKSREEVTKYLDKHESEINDNLIMAQEYQQCQMTAIWY